MKDAASSVTCTLERHGVVTAAVEDFLFFDEGQSFLCGAGVPLKERNGLLPWRN